MDLFAPDQTLTSAAAPLKKICDQNSFEGFIARLQLLVRESTAAASLSRLGAT